ncbi:flagellar biosynthesis protein FlhB [Clostridium grantii]|uniref:Flagellar biosynthetic protein FlhB n=1 Tax=Clostridium grantii DSM 8605 TaxID=1121316 RepID=A0A1M5XIR6_9CLOT|nr:flagellar biosynthesis protein FlhB [Clostridium grantii]SHH99765.1 flagellar biosynthetic protein FlhB [Clostridium grantii DSM 8605]
MINNLSFYILIVHIILIIIFYYRKPPAFSFAGSFENKISINTRKISNLFLVEDEKTEDPTPKKYQDAKKKGQIAKSQDLNSSLQLFIFALVASGLGNSIFKTIANYLRQGLSTNYMMNFTSSSVRSFFTAQILVLIQIIIPVFGVLFISAIVINLAQTRFNYSFHPLKPDFKKLNPIEGFKRLFSKKVFFGLLKNLAKLGLVTYICYNFIKDNIVDIQQISLTSVNNYYTYLSQLLGGFIMKFAIILVMVGIVDYVYQRYDFKKSLKMTKHEVKEEYKQIEGDPLIKSKRKQKQRQLAMNRMMADVEKASVIVTNPTHLALAIRYDESIDDAPKLLAKGADNLAAKIREIAKAKDIPIIENKPLARVIYKRVKIGQEIPAEFYGALAEILAFIYKLEQKKRNFTKSRRRV